MKTLFKIFMAGCGIVISGILLLAIIVSQVDVPSNTTETGQIWAKPQYIKLHDASKYYETYHNINVWAKQTDAGKLPIVGSIPAGSQVRVIGEGFEDYKVKLSNGIVGWINKMHFDE